MKENFLSYLVISVFCCQFPPLLSYNCFYASKSIVRNSYPQITTGWTVRPHLDISLPLSREDSVWRSVLGLNKYLNP